MKAGPGPGRRSREIRPPRRRTRVRGPKGRIDDLTPTYRLRSTDAGSTFRCKVDRTRYRRCPKLTTFHLHPGPHTLRFRAMDPQGNLDPTPAKRKLKVVRD